MSETDTDTDNTERESTTRAALLADNDPVSVLDRLPNTVFPMRVTVHLPRVRDHDTPDEKFSGSTHPVEVQRPRGPYIPETTIHIDNPAQRPPEDATLWSGSTVRDELVKLREYIEGTITDADALRIVALDLVEIPPHFVTTDAQTGDLCAKPDLYEQRGTLRMARFEKEGSLAASEVRDQITHSLPGESRTPIRLTRVTEAQAKPARQGWNTTGTTGRARYFTDKHAEQAGDLGLTPAIYQLEAANGTDARTRPLSSILPHLTDVLPAVADADPELVTTVTFAGEQREQTVFYASEVMR